MLTEAKTEHTVCFQHAELQCPPAPLFSPIDAVYVPYLSVACAKGGIDSLRGTGHLWLSRQVCNSNQLLLWMLLLLHADAMPNTGSAAHTRGKTWGRTFTALTPR